jgi:hypothetical protein
MKVKSVLFITTTAMLLALTIVFQLLMRSIIPAGILQQIVMGSLVNLCLIVAAGIAGVWSGVIISVIAPVVSLALGHMPLAWLLPFVMIGNALIVVIYWLFMKKSQILGFTVGAAAKTAFLWAGVVLAGLSFLGASEAQAKAISLAYSWPQLITGIVGGVISLPIVKALRPRYAEKTEAKA